MASILQPKNVFDVSDSGSSEGHKQLTTHQSRFPSHSQYERLPAKRAISSTDGFQPLGWNGVNNIWQPRAQPPPNGKITGRDQPSKSPPHEQSSGYISHGLQSSRNTPQWTPDSSLSLSDPHLGPVIPPVRQKYDEPVASIPTSLSLSKSGLLSGSNPDIDPISQPAHTQHSIGLPVPPKSWHKIREFQPLGVLQNGQQITQGRFAKQHPQSRNIPSFAGATLSADGSGLAARHYPEAVHLQPQGFVTDEYRNVRSNAQTSLANERHFGFGNAEITYGEEALPATMHNLNLGYSFEQPFEDENNPPAVGQFQSHSHREMKSSFFPGSMTSNGERVAQHNGLSRHVPEYRNAHNQRFGYVGLKESASPSTAEFRSKANTPYFPTNVTPPASSESHRSNSASVSSTRGSHGQVAILDQRLKHLEQQQEGYLTRPNAYQNGSSFPISYDYGSMPAVMRPQYYAPNQQLSGVYPGDLVVVDRQTDAGHVMRSPLLEEFRTNSKTQRYELKDIYNHVVEFSGDQHGSRFIQQKLETANSDEKDQIFNEVAYDSLQLMTDVFGNYVIQKMFEHGNQSQKKVLANYMKGHVLALSMQMYGCRVVQKALDHILTDQQASLIKELDGHVLKVVENQNGNHVIQKAIERVPGQHIQFIVDAHRGHVYELSKHAYGCRVIQRMLEHCQPHAKRAILDELQQNIGLLIKDSFGNYVVQHVIVNGELKDRRPVIDMVSADLLTNSKHKFASNVVEKAIDYAEEEQRHAIMQHLTTGRDKYGQTHVLELLTDQYGNYVIQKCLSHLKGIALQDLIFEVEQYLIQLRRVSSGKQVGALEISVKEARQRLELERSGNNMHITGQQW